MAVKDRVSLVTEAGSGIGEAVAKSLAKNGARVVVSDVDKEKVDKVVKEIQNDGGQAIGITADVSKKDQVQEMFKKIIESFGRIDILVNCADMVKNSNILELTEEDWDKVIDFNLKGTFLCCQAASKHMKEQKYGRIINVSSREMLGWPEETNYSASKGGIVSLSRSLAMELGKDGIRVNCVAAGLIKTPYFDGLPKEQQESLIKAQPMGIIGKPEDVAFAVLYFADDEAGYITGQTLYICGGRGVLSSLSC
ncbi:MAG TPA: beta-ketoacyl-ACP reductase [Desulfotomaculum sp.]|nr:beta-ketoacyl-ACP reductase [Desulfotomaculum sp.]